MNKQKNTALDGSPMDRLIFDQGLSVFSTSAYIIIAALQADGQKPALKFIGDRWNEKPEELDKSLAELQGRNIIVRHPAESEAEGPVYLVNPASLWQQPGSNGRD